MSHAGSLSSASMMFYNCTHLVGCADGFVPSNTSGATVCKLGTGGVLTNPSADIRGFDPSHLTSLHLTFGSCSNLVTIYADSSWALPSSGLSGSQTFYNCNALVGGNGTTYASTRTGYAYMRIDTANSAGYLTAA